MNATAEITHRALAPLDMAIIGVYFLIVFCIGLYFARKERTSTDYFLASRDIGWFSSARRCSCRTSRPSTSSDSSGTGASLGTGGRPLRVAGVPDSADLWAGCSCPFICASNVFTMPEFLERRFNRQCAVYLAAHLDHRLHLHQNFCAALCARSDGARARRGLVLLKTADRPGDRDRHLHDRGRTGRRHLHRYGPDTDSDHRCGRADGDRPASRWAASEHLRTDGPAELLPHDQADASDPDFPWTGIFFGAPILGIWYWCTDQVIVQRVLSARDEGHAKAGTIFAGFLKILPVFMLVLPGIIALSRSVPASGWPGQARRRLSHSGSQSAADWTGGPGDGRVAGGGDGRA